MALNAKLIMVNVPASNPKAVSSFYSSLLGIDFVPAWSDHVTGFHAPVSADGIKLSVQEPGQGQSGVAIIFAVDDLQGAIAEVEKMGGRAVGSPFDLPISESAMTAYGNAVKTAGLPTAAVTAKIGTAAVVKDPGGTSLVLVQLDPAAQYSFKTGPYHQGLSTVQMEEHKRELDASSALSFGSASS